MRKQFKSEIELDLEIRGEVGYIVKKHHLSDAAAADIYKMFCGQAKRWEAKVTAHIDRISNQRKEINRLLAIKTTIDDSAQPATEGR